MCNLCEPLLSDKTRKMFEPGCGTGNFLAETLSRRLETISNPHDALVALSNLYGADINADYLITARSRLKSIILQRLPGSFLDYRFLPLVDLFLQSNLIQGDLIDHYEKITFVDWQPISEYNFRATPTRLSDMLDQTASALSSKVSAKTAPIFCKTFRSKTMSDFPNDTPGKATFSLRPEQQAAIDQTYHYWQQTSSPKVPTNDSTVKSSQPQTLSVDIPSTKPSPRQFLWNAKPRFGKTFAAYEFARKINARRILIITNRPAISDAWASDFSPMSRRKPITSLLVLSLIPVRRPPLLKSPHQHPLLVPTFSPHTSLVKFSHLLPFRTHSPPRTSRTPARLLHLAPRHQRQRTLPPPISRPKISGFSTSKRLGLAHHRRKPRGN